MNRNNDQEKLRISSEKVAVIKLACGFWEGSFSTANIGKSLHDFIESDLEEINESLYKHFYPAQRRPDNRTIMRSLGLDTQQPYVSYNQHVLLESLFDEYIEKFGRMPGMAPVIESTIRRVKEDRNPLIEELDIFSKSTFFDIGFVESSNWSIESSNIYLDDLYIERTVEEELHDIVTNAGSYSITLISGEAGCGKSSLVWNFYRQYETDDRFHSIFIKSTHLVEQGVGRTLLTLNNLTRKRILIFVDTVDLILYNSATRDLALNFFLAVRETNSICFATSRPQELSMLRPLLDRGVVYSVRYLGEYDEENELPMAVNKYATVYLESKRNVDPQKILDVTRRITSTDRPLKALGLNPLTLRMLFSVYAPLEMPDEINVFQLYGKFWDDRVAADKRAGHLDYGYEGRDLSETATKIALIMLADGKISLPFDENNSKAKYGVQYVDVKHLISRGVLRKNHDGQVEFFHQTFFEHAAGRMLLVVLKTKAIALCQSRVFPAKSGTNYFMHPIFVQVLLLAESYEFNDYYRNAVARLFKSRNIDKIRIAIYVYSFFAKEYDEVFDAFYAMLKSFSKEEFVIVKKYLSAAANTPAKRLFNCFRLLQAIWERRIWVERYHTMDLLEYYSTKAPAETITFFMRNNISDAICRVDSSQRQISSDATHMLARTLSNLYSVNDQFVVAECRKIIEFNESKVHYILFGVLCKNISKEHVFEMESLLEFGYSIHKDSLFRKRGYCEALPSIVCAIYHHKWRYLQAPAENILEEITREKRPVIKMAKVLGLGLLCSSIPSDQQDVMVLYFRNYSVVEDLFSAGKALLIGILQSAQGSLVVKFLDYFKEVVQRLRKMGPDRDKQVTESVVIACYIDAIEKVPEDNSKIINSSLKEILKPHILSGLHPKIPSLVFSLYVLQCEAAIDFIRNKALFYGEYKALANGICVCIIESERDVSELFELTLQLSIEHKLVSLICSLLDRIADKIGLFIDKEKVPSYLLRYRNKLTSLVEEFATTNDRDAKVSSAHLLFSLCRLGIIPIMTLQEIDTLYPKKITDIYSWIVQMYPYCPSSSPDELEVLLNNCRLGFLHKSEKIQSKSEKAFLFLMYNCDFDCSGYLEEIKSVFFSSTRDLNGLKIKLVNRIISKYTAINNKFSFDLFYALIISEQLSAEKIKNENEIMHELRFGFMSLCRKLDYDEAIFLINTLKFTGCEFGKMIIDGLASNADLFKKITPNLDSISTLKKTKACIKSNLSDVLQFKTKSETDFSWSELLDYAME